MEASTVARALEVSTPPAKHAAKVCLRRSSLARPPSVVSVTERRSAMAKQRSVRRSCWESSLMGGSGEEGSGALVLVMGEVLEPQHVC